MDLAIANNGESKILLDESTYAFAFEDFLLDYGRVYDDAAEHAKREAIFYENLNTIVEHNNNRLKTAKNDRGGHALGVNVLADRRAKELHMGYDKYQRSHLQYQTGGHTASVSRRLVAEDDIEKRLSIQIEKVNDLPQHVDWRTKGVATPVKSQGMCGSWWAFASTSVLESHIALQRGTLYELSPQELMSCAPNRQHCGGTGGCVGATTELNFDLVRAKGIVQEWDLGYQDAHGGAVNCTLARPNHKFTRNDKQYFRGAVAGIADYAVLPSNNYTVLMNTVAKLGCRGFCINQVSFMHPWIVVAGYGFRSYTWVVVLEGYGTDEETGEDYCLVCNSWGPKWGEKGKRRASGGHTFCLRLLLV